MERVFNYGNRQVLTAQSDTPPDGATEAPLVSLKTIHENIVP